MKKSTFHSSWYVHEMFSVHLYNCALGTRCDNMFTSTFSIVYYSSDYNSWL